MLASTEDGGGRLTAKAWRDQVEKEFTEETQNTLLENALKTARNGEGGPASGFLKGYARMYEKSFAEVVDQVKTSVTEIVEQAKKVGAEFAEQAKKDGTELIAQIQEGVAKIVQEAATKTDPQVAENIRKGLRKLGADLLDKLPAKFRVKALGKLIKAQPNPKMEGEMFSEFAKRYPPRGMEAAEAAEGGLKIADADIIGDRILRVTRETRMPNGRVLGEGDLLMIDDKAGKKAFTSGDAKAYGEAFKDNKVLKTLDKTEHKGLGFSFQEYDAAKRASDFIRDAPILNKDKIHVGYFDSDAVFQWLR